MRKEMIMDSLRLMVEFLYTPKECLIRLHLNKNEYLFICNIYAEYHDEIIMMFADMDIVNTLDYEGWLIENM